MSRSSSSFFVSLGVPVKPCRYYRGRPAGKPSLFCLSFSPDLGNFQQISGGRFWLLHYPASGLRQAGAADCRAFRPNFENGGRIAAGSARGRFFDPLGLRTGKPGSPERICRFFPCRGSADKQDYEVNKKAGELFVYYHGQIRKHSSRIVKGRGRQSTYNRKKEGGGRSFLPAGFPPVRRRRTE